MSDPEEHLTSNNEDMLTIQPSDVIVLTKTDDATEGELKGTVNITCTAKYTVTYKIKTTAPLKFRVRPSSGALSPGASVTVYVILQPGSKVSPSSKDKFLVMCSPLPDDIDPINCDMLAGFWKALPTNSPNIQLHRLQCVLSGETGSHVQNGHAYSEEVGDGVNIAQLAQTIKRIDQRSKLCVKLHWLSLLMFIICSICITYLLKQEIQDQRVNTCSRRY